MMLLLSRARSVARTSSSICSNRTLCASSSSSDWFGNSSPFASPVITGGPLKIKKIINEHQSSGESSDGFVTSELDRVKRIFHDSSQLTDRQQRVCSDGQSHHHVHLRGSIDAGQQQIVNGIPVSKYHQFDQHLLFDLLTRKKVEYKYDEGRQAVILKYCPFCHDHKNKLDNLWKLFFSSSSGRFSCLRCGNRGSFYDFQKHINGVSVMPFSSNFQPHNSTGAVQPLRNSEMNCYAVPRDAENLFSPDFVEAFQYLTEKRGLEKRVLELYKVGARLEPFSSGRHQCVTFPSIHGKSVPKIKVRSIVEKSNQRSHPVGGAPGLFGFHTIPNDAKSVIITEGEFDAMAAYQGTGVPAISLPNGARSMPVELIPVLERFEKIYLWLDDDVPGQEGADKIAKKLGLSRCYIVRCRGNDAEGPKDANDVLKMGGDMKILLDQASRLRHNQIATFNDLRDEIFLEIVEGKKLHGVPFQTLPRFTSILKGHRKGELTILTGATGVGKTTVLSQMSVDLCTQGVPTLWGSFEIQNHRLAKMMMSQKANICVTPTNFNEIADQFEDLPLFFLKFHGSTDVGSVLDAMDHAVYVYDVEHIILDNLQFMLGMGSSKFDRFDQQDFAIQSLRKFATKKNVHITLAVHPRKENDGEMLGITSVFGSAKVTQEADNVILVQCLDRDRLLRTVNVQKNRFDGDSGHIPFRFDKSSRRIIELTPHEFEELKRQISESGGFLSQTAHGPIGGSAALASEVTKRTADLQKQHHHHHINSVPSLAIPDSISSSSVLFE